MNLHRSLRSSRLLIAALLAVAALWAGGCAHQSQLHFEYDAEGQPLAYRRVEKHLVRDYFHHVSPQAYFQPNDSLLHTMHGDMAAVYAELGMPGWVRRPFTSFYNEPVEEWVYLTQDRLLQFIDGTLVFDGPVTDIEKILIKRGYPSKVNGNRLEPDDSVTLFIYDRVFGPGLDEYHFNNGTLTHYKEDR